MEEAVTDQIIKTTQMQIDPMLKQMNQIVSEDAGEYNNSPSQRDAPQPQMDENIVDIHTHPQSLNQINEEPGRTLDQAETSGIREDTRLANEKAPILEEGERRPAEVAASVEKTHEPVVEVETREALAAQNATAMTASPEYDQVIQQMPENPVLTGWSLREVEYKDTIAKYLSRLDEVQRESFAPLDILVAHSLLGFDLQVLALVSEGHEPTAETIFGLVIFNEEASAIKTAAGTSSLKVILHHVSCLQIEQREKLFDNAMEYIWKHTHCSAIRVSLYHSKSKDSGMLKADPALKQFLKSRKFKWKTVVNDVSSGSRSEILEVANLNF